MRQSTQKTSRSARLTRLLLAAFCVGLFCVPQTWADSNSRTHLTRLGAEAANDFTGGSHPFENSSWRSSETASAHTAASAASPGPVTISPAPVQSSCAPLRYSFGFYPVYWYELINTNWSTSCSPGWVFQNGYQPIVGKACTLGLSRYASLVVLPDAGTFSQDFFVPHDVTGSPEVALTYQTLGNGSHWDRIYVSLWEGNTFLAEYAFPSLNNCGTWKYPIYGNYAGKNLRLQVAGSIVTPGVTHRIESIRVVSSYIP